ncbi:hypothetical protein AHAS_Ahas15G0246800 [Arachis hypogaea]
MLLEASATSMLSATLSTSASKTTASTRNPPSIPDGEVDAEVNADKFGGGEEVGEDVLSVWRFLKCKKCESPKCKCMCWYVQSVMGIGVLLYASSAKALRVMANVVSLFHNNHAVRERRGTCGSAVIGSRLGGAIWEVAEPLNNNNNMKY